MLQEKLDGCLVDQAEGAERDEISEFFAYAVRRDRQRAIDRGCSLEDAEWRGCEIEEEFDDACVPASVVSGTPFLLYLLLIPSPAPLSSLLTPPYTLVSLSACYTSLAPL